MKIFAINTSLRFRNFFLIFEKSVRNFFVNFVVIFDIKMSRCDLQQLLVKLNALMFVVKINLTNLTSLMLKKMLLCATFECFENKLKW